MVGFINRGSIALHCALSTQRRAQFALMQRRRQLKIIVDDDDGNIVTIESFERRVAQNVDFAQVEANFPLQAQQYCLRLFA